MSSPLLEQHLLNARILIVDGGATSANDLTPILERAGYFNLVCARDCAQAKALIGEQRPELMLLDLTTSHFDAFALLTQIKNKFGPDESLPVLAITTDADSEARHRVLKEGALDYLVKPFEQFEVALRVHNALTLAYLSRRERERTLALRDEQQSRAQKLEQSNLLLKQANDDLASANAHLQWAHHEFEQAQNEIVNRLAQAVEVRGEPPACSPNRVGQLAEELAREMRLNERQIQLIRHAAPLHDIGKIGVSESVLLKPSPLTPDELEEARSHVEIGAAMLGQSEIALMQMAATIAYTHHERWDGKGYPLGLVGEETPIEGRILAVVDVFDALTTKRPYKEAWTQQQALAEIEAQSSSQFDPAVVSAFSRLMQKNMAFGESCAPQSEK